jgi:hypothetical protein
MLPRALFLMCVTSAWCVPYAARGQDGHIMYPVDTIERRLRDMPFQPLAQEGSRFTGDRTQHALLRFADSSAMEVKWAKAPEGGEAFNNQPRYELAAYELQKLFLNEPDYVVPPTVVRMIPLDEYRRYNKNVQPTFSKAKSVLVVLQYWTMDVTADGVFDRKRAERDTVYARHLGDLNVLTYLIRHSDSNKGNVMIATDTANPRLFAVDNGVAFASPPSSRGTDWARLRVDKLPAATVQRLRKITSQALADSLGVVAQFELRDGTYVPAPRGPNVDRTLGVRKSGSTLQLGLTRSEIEGVRDRLEQLLSDVDKGRIKTW